MSNLVVVVPGAQTSTYHEEASCAHRGGTWPAIRISERAAREVYDLDACKRCAQGRPERYEKRHRLLRAKGHIEEELEGL